MRCWRPAVVLIGTILALAGWLVVPELTHWGESEPVGQVSVVMAARDIAAGDSVDADALTVQTFSADLVPQGAIPALEQASGKYAATRIAKGQIVLVNQLSTSRCPGDARCRWRPLPTPPRLPAEEMVAPMSRVRF